MNKSQLQSKSAKCDWLLRKSISITPEQPRPIGARVDPGMKTVE